jgi:hypothetical protein
MNEKTLSSVEARMVAKWLKDKNIEASQDDIYRLTPAEAARKFGVTADQIRQAARRPVADE